MKTKRLFDKAPYIESFEAEVVSVDKINENWGIILDRTCFYPESGGQPHDSGFLNNIGVLKVVESDGGIIHIVEKKIERGSLVKGVIEWERRFDHMQQHTGQHILSQSFVKMKGLDTIEFHLGKEISTIDVNSKNISSVDIRKVEIQANKIVLENRDVLVKIMDKKDLESIPIRKFPEGIDRFRVIEINDFDRTACCGTHVRKTGEIGLIKITGSENYKGGTRIKFKCGWRAVADYQKKESIIKNTCRQLTAGESEITEIITKLKSEQKKNIKYIKSLIKRNLELELNYLADNVEVKDGIKIVVTKYLDREADEISLLLRKLIKRKKSIALIGLAAEQAYLFFGRSEDVDVDIRPVMDAACNIIEGRGGGSHSLAQAKGINTEKLDTALAEAYEMIKKEIV